MEYGNNLYCLFRCQCDNVLCSGCSRRKCLSLALWKFRAKDHEICKKFELPFKNLALSSWCAWPWRRECPEDYLCSYLVFFIQRFVCYCQKCFVGWEIKRFVGDLMKSFVGSCNQLSFLCRFDKRWINEEFFLVLE